MMILAVGFWSFRKRIIKSPQFLKIRLDFLTV